MLHKNKNIVMIINKPNTEIVVGSSEIMLLQQLLNKLKSMMN
jgi:hypothetical protein